MSFPFLFYVPFGEILTFMLSLFDEGGCKISPRASIGRNDRIDSID